jgi:hypothetical protein
MRSSKKTYRITKVGQADIKAPLGRNSWPPELIFGTELAYSHV